MYYLTNFSRDTKQCAGDLAVLTTITGNSLLFSSIR